MPTCCGKSHSCQYVLHCLPLAKLCACKYQGKDLEVSRGTGIVLAQSLYLTSSRCSPATLMGMLGGRCYCSRLIAKNLDVTCATTTVCVFRYTCLNMSNELI